MAHHHHSHDHHHEGDGHGHGHHHHGPATYNRAFAIGIGLNTAFILAEVIYGIQAHALALLADAGHNMGDVLGLVLAWGATLLAKRAPSTRRTYGIRRFSILSALINSLILMVAIGGIVWEAIHRFANPEPIATKTVIIVALIGIVINTGTALGFLSGRKDDLNIRGAFLHMLGDAAASAGVVIAAIAIATTGWLWLDPAISIVLAILIAIGSWGLLRDSLNLAMDGVPAGINPDAVKEYLAGLPGITEVHDLHIWGMSTTEVALTVHLVRPNASNNDDFLSDACVQLRKRFNIGHATLQIEQGNASHPCALAPAEVV